MASADRVLVVGTSLPVYPATGLLNYAQRRSEKVLITRVVEHLPLGFQWLLGKAERVPALDKSWRQAGSAPALLGLFFAILVGSTALLIT